MNKYEFQEWLKKLPELTKEQSAEVLSRIKILGGSDDYSGKSDFDSRVLSAICDVLRKNNIENISPHFLRKSVAYANARGKMDDLSAFFGRISKQRMVQDAILRNGLELLYYDLVSMNIAVSSHTLLNHIHRIPATLNRHFPGYAQSGMLHKIVKEG
jgi:hypothetical protein